MFVSISTAIIAVAMAQGDAVRSPDMLDTLHRYCDQSFAALTDTMADTNSPNWTGPRQDRIISIQECSSSSAVIQTLNQSGEFVDVGWQVTRKDDDRLYLQLWNLINRTSVPEPRFAVKYSEPGTHAEALFYHLRDGHAESHQVTGSYGRPFTVIELNDDQSRLEFGWMFHGPFTTVDLSDPVERP